MPSALHEAVVEMFRNRPRLAAELLAGQLGLPLPVFEHARVETGEFTDVSPAEFRADAVVVLTAAGEPVQVVVVEVQLRRDPDKRWTWPVYLAALRARVRRPAVLLVVCTDDAVADWCATPIELGHPGARLTPLVLGPRQVPLVTDRGLAASAPELAVLSAIAHGSGPRAAAVVPALLGAFEAAAGRPSALYADLVMATLSEVARRHLEQLMALGTYEYQSEFARRYFGQGKDEGRSEGRAEALAGAVLQVLAARGVAVPDPVRDRVRACHDVEQLDTWLSRAATADAVADLFD